ncbi:Bacterial alpha-L-rhamnosidase [Gracilibacillus salitolerans]|uniref:alpha-L-rhamnosidase n=2 Tax=Gracilibacillus salitolerans TaxID=2663022 RepID=A0A5Q2TPX4_9BACI|nr:Bacterial alpha-L-rhamnosidase [Gracilibacillus salitolerans]
MIMSFITVLVLGVLTSVWTTSSKAETESEVGITNMKVENTETPLGLDKENPAFSWQMDAPEGVRGVSQEAYRIVVEDQEGQVVWDTNKVEDTTSINMQYAGEELKPTTKYEWTVTVWDQNGNTSSKSSWFETGLMNTDISGWDEASWIGGSDDDLVLKADYFNVYKVNYSLQLDEESESTKASFVLGANDPRLMDANKNIRGVENEEDESYVAFELDASEVDGSEGGLAKLNVYRVGYTEDDSDDTPLLSYDIPENLLNADNLYDAHNFFISADSGVIEVAVNGTEDEHTVVTDGRSGVNINPVGSGGNYISYPMLADIGFSLKPDQEAFFSNVEVKNLRSPSNTLFAEDLSVEEYNGLYANEDVDGFEVDNGAYVLNGGEDGSFIVADPSKNSMPMLRTEFDTSDQQIESARLYATARGIYEMYLNGERVSEYYFTPGLTQYNESHQYQTYDVTDHLRSGETNAIGAMLGEGWWSGAITFTTSRWNHFGDRQSLLAKLVITYEDGSKEVVTTNPDWKYYDEGPVVYGSFFQGEYYDATKEEAVDGWSQAGYDENNWEPAEVVPLDEKTTPDDNGLSYDNMELIGQIGEAPRVVETLTAQDVTEVRDGVFVYDMGQNAVGVPQITLKDQEAGNKVTLRVAEMLYPDLPESGDNVGMIMQENLRAALNQDNYITKDGEQVIQPSFTFHGYRYLEITGIDEALPLEDVKTLVISSVDELSASYETSNESVNKLFENISWSMRGNFLSIPTDTPARNERMGWGGDISVFAETSTYLADVNEFLDRHLLALRDMQEDNGKFTDVAPVGGGFGGILWGSAGITVAWEAYQQFGDTQLLEDHYQAMANYMSYLDSVVDPETGFITESQLDDWLSPERGQTGAQNLWVAYHAYDLWIMSQVAEVLGKAEDASMYLEQYNERKAFFNDIFVDDETKKTLKDDGTIADTQASYAVPLALDIFNEENIPYAAKHLAETVKRENNDDEGITRPEYSLMTGFIGTAAVNKALSDNGYHDIAYRLLQQTSYPSWLYSVENGATTIWERLNSYTEEAGFGGNNSMNSFNHYSFGAVGSWMMSHSLGIERDQNNPGFKHFILQPNPDPDKNMTYAKGNYDSMYGTIESSWEVKNKTFNYNVTVPANTTATLNIPTHNENTVKESNQPIQKVDGVTFEDYKDGKAVYELESGSYEFRSILEQ